VINWDAKVNTVADHHQTVKAVVTIAMLSSVCSIPNHIILCIFAMQFDEDVFVRASFDPTPGSIDE
jgi:hypothetical protein